MSDNEQMSLDEAMDKITAAMEQGFRRASARSIAMRIVREQGLHLTMEKFESLVDITLKNVNKALDGGAA